MAVKFSLLVALALSVSAFGGTLVPTPTPKPPIAFPQPPVLAPGTYTGVLTVRRTLLADGLSNSYTLKADAKITTDGHITILTNAQETPAAAANIEDSIVRAEPRQIVFTPLPYPISIPLSGKLQPVLADGSAVSANAIQNNVAFFFSNYTVNGSIPARVTTNNAMVYLNYQLPSRTFFPPILFPVDPIDPVTISGGAAANAATAPSTVSPSAIWYQPNQVSFEFALRMVGTGGTLIPLRR